MRALRYAVDEAAKSLWRGRPSGLLSTATIALALFVLGAFLLVTSNLERLAAEWAGAAELSVYLSDDVRDQDRRAIEGVLAPGDLIAASEYVSKAEALRRFKQTFADLAVAVDGVGDNPLPASYEIRLRNRAASGQAGTVEALDGLGARLRAMPGVADVRYDQRWLTRLLSTVSVVRRVGFALGGVLALAAGLTVANVVRLALVARRDELDIMELVGAPQVYIRGPFVMEGVLQGGAGALAALVVLAAVFVSVRARYLAPLASTLNLSSIEFLPVWLACALVAGGMGVGCLGGLVAGWGRR